MMETNLNTGTTYGGRSIDNNDLLLYEATKKNRGTALILSCLVTSAGHAYAGNWGRGLIFTGVRLLGAVVAITGGVTTKTTQSSSYYGYSNTSELEISPIYYVGIGISLVAAIWELVDAGNEVDRYNKKLYDRIVNKQHSMGINIIPNQHGGASMVFSYQL
jgi:hypothetical protein